VSFKGKKNIYICEGCRCSITTIDKDDGVTPYLVKCRVTPGCSKLMRSQFYRVDQVLEPNYEWYKPDDSEKIERGYEEHVAMGGLLLRKIS
jgi:hypothetical protein